MEYGHVRIGCLCESTDEPGPVVLSCPCGLCVVRVVAWVSCGMQHVGDHKYRVMRLSSVQCRVGMCANHEWHVVNADQCCRSWGWCNVCDRMSLLYCLGSCGCGVPLRWCRVMCICLFRAMSLREEIYLVGLCVSDRCRGVVTSQCCSLWGCCISCVCHVWLFIVYACRVHMCVCVRV